MTTPETRKAYFKAYYQKRKAEICAHVREYAKINREKVLENKRRYYLTRRDDPHFRAVKLKTQRAFFARHGYWWKPTSARRNSEHTKRGCAHAYRMNQVMRGKLVNSKKVIQETGVTATELRAHFAAQFTPDMSWHNYGYYWSVDHIKPKKAFNLAKEEDRKLCFHYTNLRPLPCSENINNRTK